MTAFVALSYLSMGKLPNSSVNLTALNVACSTLRASRVVGRLARTRSLEITE